MGTIIHQGDCLEVMKDIPNDSIDLIITSPPYNVGVDYDVYKDNLSWEQYLQWTHQWLECCYRVLKDDGRICVNHYIAFKDWEKKDRMPIMDIRNIQQSIGYNVCKLVIWQEDTFLLNAFGSWKSASAPNIQLPYEGILISYKNQWQKEEQGESTVTADEFKYWIKGVWKMAPSKRYTKSNFPIELPMRCIKMLSYKDDVILDPFVGSGTTCVAAKKLERRYIGIEVSSEYVQIANKRLRKTYLHNPIDSYW